MLADDLEHGLGVGGVFERLAEFSLVQKLGDVGERVEVFLKLALGNEEKHDEVDRLVVERIELDPALGAAQGADDLGDQIGRGVRNADAKPDARAHGRLALLDDGGDGVFILGLDLAGGHEVVDQLINGLPAVRRLQVRDDLRV